MNKGNDNMMSESKKRKAIPANCSFNPKQGGYETWIKLDALLPLGSVRLEKRRSPILQERVKMLEENKKEKIMKKIIAVIVVVMMLFVFVSTAHASTYTVYRAPYGSRTGVFYQRSWDLVKGKTTSNNNKAIECKTNVSTTSNTTEKVISATGYIETETRVVLYNSSGSHTVDFKRDNNIIQRINIPFRGSGTWIFRAKYYL